MDYYAKLHDSAEKGSSRKDLLYGKAKRRPRTPSAEVHVAKADQLKVMALHRRHGKGHNLGSWRAILNVSKGKVCNCHPLERISVDIWGPCEVPRQGERSTLLLSLMTTQESSKLPQLEAVAIRNKWENQLDMDRMAVLKLEQVMMGLWRQSSRGTKMRNSSITSMEAIRPSRYGTSTLASAD